MRTGDSRPEIRIPIEWARYRLKGEVVGREVSALRAYSFRSVVVPPVGPEDFALLAASVHANGVYDPLTVTPESEVVDGRARLRAAIEGGIHQVPTRILEADSGEEDYALWAALANAGRRHLAPAEKFALVKAILGLLEARARARQVSKRFGSRAEPGAAEGPNVDGPSDVRSQVGALIGVSRSQAAKLISVIKNGSDDLQDAVASGRTSIHRAHAVLKHLDEQHPAAEAVKMLRTIAARIPQWIEGAEHWPIDARAELLATVQDVVDSCELTFRRLAFKRRS